MYQSKWEIKGKICGIYKITNNFTKECYIGASKNIIRRWNEHYYKYKSEKDREYSSILHTKMREYGIENFSFEIVELCEFEEIYIKEKYYIKKFKSEYNFTLGGKGGKYGKPKKFNEIVYDLKNTNKTLKQIAKDYGYCYDTIKNINLGKNWYDESLSYPIRNVSLSKTLTILYYNPIIQLDKNGNFIARYNNEKEFCEKYGYTSKHSACGHIYQVCRGKRKSAFGFLWKFEKDYNKN